jgi:hypothetical protein
MKRTGILILILVTLLLASCAHVQTPDEEALCLLNEVCPSVKELK